MEFEKPNLNRIRFSERSLCYLVENGVKLENILKISSETQEILEIILCLLSIIGKRAFNNDYPEVFTKSKYKYDDFFDMFQIPASCYTDNLAICKDSLNIGKFVYTFDFINEKKVEERDYCDYDFDQFNCKINPSDIDKIIKIQQARDFSNKTEAVNVPLENLELYLQKELVKNEFTYNEEGNDDPNSPFSCFYPHVPTDNSGVTIGHGFDLKEQNQEFIESTLGEVGFSKDIVSNFVKARGLKGDAAKTFLNDTKVSFEGKIVPLSKVYFSAERNKKMFNIVYSEKLKIVKQQFTEKKIDLTKFEENYSDKAEILLTLCGDFAYHNGEMKIALMKLVEDYVNSKNCEPLITYFDSKQSSRNKKRAKLAEKLKF